MCNARYTINSKKHTHNKNNSTILTFLPKQIYASICTEEISIVIPTKLNNCNFSSLPKDNCIQESDDYIALGNNISPCVPTNT